MPTSLIVQLPYELNLRIGGAVSGAELLKHDCQYCAEMTVMTGSEADIGLACIAAVLGRTLESSELECELSDLGGWDSIMYVRLMLSLEQELGRELTDSEMENLSSVRDVQQLVGRLPRG